MYPKAAIALCVIFLCCMAGCLDESQTVPATPTGQPTAITATPTSTPITLKVDSFDLALEFDDNELAAEAKYEGRLIEVSGMILEITEIGGKPYVKLDGLDEYGFSCVMCEFSEDRVSQLYSLRKYDMVTIRGAYSNYIMSRVKLEDCELMSVDGEY